MRWIQHKEKRAMRQAEEYKERMWMNELTWQQFKAICQLEQHSTLSQAIRGVHRHLHRFNHTFGRHLGPVRPVTVSCIAYPSITLYSFLHFEGSLHSIICIRGNVIDSFALLVPLCCGVLLIDGHLRCILVALTM